MIARGRTTALATLLLLLAAGCGGPGEADGVAVARIDDDSITRAELEYYFKTNLLEETGDAPLPVEEMNAVRSRLLDALIEERILLTEAEVREIRVVEIEIDAYLAERAPDFPDEPIDVEQQRREARRRLRIEKLQAKIALEMPPIEDHEIRGYIEGQAGQGEDRELVIRALMLEDRETADRVHRDIKRNRITFTEAVVTHGDPAQGLPVKVSWLSLPEQVREVLDGMKTGRVSDPVEMLGSTYLFQIDSWIGGPAEIHGERARQAIDELEDLRRRRAFDAVLDQARERTRVRILRRNLPFDYVAPDEP